MALIQEPLDAKIVRCMTNMYPVPRMTQVSAMSAPDPKRTFGSPPARYIRLSADWSAVGGRSMAIWLRVPLNPSMAPMRPIKSSRLAVALVDANSRWFASAHMAVDQAQDDCIEAIGAGTGRDDHNQHDRIQGFRQIEPIIDPVCSIDRLECSYSRSP
jgi:hypothetical protein